MQQSTQHRLILIITLIVVFFLWFWLVMKTKGILENQYEIVQKEKTKVAIITSDVTADQSWGSLAYKGQLKIEEEFPVTVDFYSEINNEMKMEKTLTKAIKNGSLIIIGHGREFSSIFTKLAPQYPNIHFVTLHGTAKHPNQTVYTYDLGDIEYFAALAATLKTRTNRIAVLDSIYSPADNIEFKKGLSYYKPEVKFYYEFTNSRHDGDKAIELMNNLIDKGVDVIYSKGNAFNSNVIDLAKKKNVYIIGYIDDQAYMGKEKVLTSVIHDVPEIYVSIMKDYFSKKGIPSGTVVLNQSDNVYRLAPFGPMFTEKEIDYIIAEMERFQNGDLPF